VSDKQVAHMVFFTLKESSNETVQALIDSCNCYLTDHDGVVYYSVGARGAEFDRPLNKQTYDVGLHVVFADKAAHDVYQTAPRHLTFIAENKDSWETVGIFDSYV
jgi:hypothetical protein